MKEPNYITRPKFLASLKLLLEEYNIIITSCNGCEGAYIAEPDDETIDSCIAHLDSNDMRIDDPHAT